ncbi:MAG: helix-turn-helix domain-containing protein, partial [Frankia sp.]|nr:helix-turn-helix domain-containing protein [Frankia sp.]
MTAPGDGAAGGTGPTARRILLGAQLRRLREERGISREQAGYHIRASESKISRLELGRVSFKERDVADLLTLYGVTEEAERAPFLALVRDANKQGWWQSFSDVLPHWFQPYIGLEESASQIRSYQVQFVPGLLQTEDYARAIITRGNRGAPAEVIDGRVQVRMNRQRLLTRPDAPRLWMVIDEAALWRPI